MSPTKTSTQETMAVPNILFKAKQFFALSKFRLSALVVFSGAIGYAMGANTIDWLAFFFLCLGSFFVTAGANTINQIWERDLDKLMKRTQNRPMPTGTLSVSEGIIFTLVSSIICTIMLAVFLNLLTAILSLVSLLLYGFVYTPLKQKSPIAVFVGAFPGALPPLIGWVAATGEIGFYGFLLFLIQFAWQFPHFWAIAWVGHEDYSKAGFNLLPSGGQSLHSALQIMAYTLFLLPVGLMPWYFGMAGITSAIIISICGALFLIPSFLLVRKGDRKSALMLMFSSFFYLPIVQVALLLDKI
ncbi:MAG: protoheme IX farnesyltransferase [Bernardetiaceae bacterium]|nr:protoheme IX farnesyltransferase [Bernardetiaceae bacterium]